jgi:hypothetical protein
MRFEKKGLIIGVDNQHWWSKLYAILPTPFLLNSNTIRVFFASTCENKFGRISYVDLDATSPGTIISKSNNFVFDKGISGAFDDCGVNPSSLLKVGAEYRLYYAGYQRHELTPYSIFSGLAVSKDLESFSRIQQTPLLDRIDGELNIRSAPTVIKLDTGFYMIYVAGTGWNDMDTGLFRGRRMPIYNLRSAFSNDGINWKPSDGYLFEKSNEEFGFGRPFIFYANHIHYLFFSVRKKNEPYHIEYAISNDNCKSWVRQSKIIGLDRSPEGWDSEMICYPSVITVKDKTFLFYNGNNNGETGFGYAELIEW